MSIPLGILASSKVNTGPMTCTYLQQNSAVPVASSHTFTGENLGTASATRLIVVAVHIQHSGQTRVSGVTVGGVTATLAAESYGTTIATARSFASAIFVATVPTGTTGNVVVTSTAGMNTVCAIALWSIPNGATVSDSDGTLVTGTTGAITNTLDGVSNGIILASVFRLSALAVAWTNASEDFDVSPLGARQHAGARSTVVGTTTITATSGASTDTRRMVSVALAP